jgi:carbon monoxide dehydrogenase subunit G
MAKVNATATVPAPPEQAWATAADLSRFDEWLTLHEGWRGAVPATLSEGTELTSVVTVLGWRNRITWRVESFTPPRSIAISGNGVGGVRVALTLSVHPDGRDNSTVTIDAEVTGRPVFGPIGMAIGRAVRADMRRSVAALAELVG